MLEAKAFEPCPSHEGRGFFTSIPIHIKDNRSYDLDTLSDEARAQLTSLQFVDAELARLQAQAAVLQTARMAYAKALNEALPMLPAGETMKLN